MKLVIRPHQLNALKFSHYEIYLVMSAVLDKGISWEQLRTQANMSLEDENGDVCDCPFTEECIDAVEKCLVP